MDAPFELANGKIVRRAYKFEAWEEAALYTPHIR
jgi:hypothetical protein